MPKGGRSLNKLYVDADILVHNYRPGVAERLGLGEEELRQMNPALIWVAVTGYGRHSPGAGRPSTHPCAGAACGGASYQAGDPPYRLAGSRTPSCARSRGVWLRANESNPDPNTSVVAASAILLAFLHRERTGEGQGVYVNMLTANLYVNAEDALLLTIVNHVGASPTTNFTDCLPRIAFIGLLTDGCSLALDRMTSGFGCV